MYTRSILMSGVTTRNAYVTLVMSSATTIKRIVTNIMITVTTRMSGADLIIRSITNIMISVTDNRAQCPHSVTGIVNNNHTICMSTSSTSCLLTQFMGRSMCVFV